MKEYAYLNGKILPVEDAQLNITDLALLRGYGVFDFFRAIDGKPIFMEDHLDRFENSTAQMGLRLPESRAHYRENIHAIIQKNPHPLLGIRLVCTGGYSTDGYAPADRPNVFMLAKPFQLLPFEHGLKLMTVEHQRDLATVKSINYIRPIAILAQTRAAKADDVLYHSGGWVTESSRSNIFIVKNGRLITPEDGILRGVTRKRILGFAADILPIEIRNLSLSEVFDADEVFMTGSTKRIAPITGIDDKTYPIGSFSKQLYDRLLVEEAEGRG
jgi:D-alanine transaminase/branched-chain amino acid aminotransferase